MPSMEVLKIGRSMGYDTLKNVNVLKRGVKSSQGITKVHLDMPNPETYTSEIVQNNPMLNNLMGFVKKMYPRAYSKDLKTGVDIEVKKFGPKSGKLTMTSIARDSQGIVSESKLTGVANSTGMKLKATGKAEGTDVNYGLTILKDKKNNLIESVPQLINGIKYEENNGVSKLNLNLSNIGPVKSLSADIKAPSDLAIPESKGT